MNPLTCNEVEERIDLYAADECDEPTSAAIDCHLADCSTCAGKYDDSRKMVALLDLRLREPDRLRRLHSALDREAAARRRRSTVLPFLQRAVAVAALLLVTFGLIDRLGPSLGADRDGTTESLVAVLAPTATRAIPEPKSGLENAFFIKGGDPARVTKDGAAARTFSFQTMTKSGDALREQLRQGLIPPPDVDLTMYLFNPGPRNVNIEINEATEVEIDLRGPRVVTVPVSGAAPRMPIPLQSLALPAGQTRTLPIRRLTSVTPRGISYFYWTEPGEYELTIHLRAEAMLGRVGTRQRPAIVTLTSQPMKIVVAGNP